MSEIERLTHILIKLKKTNTKTFVYETDKLEILINEISNLKNNNSENLSNTLKSSIVHGGKF
jgi:hypothetical protein